MNFPTTDLNVALDNLARARAAYLRSLRDGDYEVMDMADMNLTIAIEQVRQAREAQGVA